MEHSLCSRKCSWITRARWARRYVLSSVIYALQPLSCGGLFEDRIVGEIEIASVASVRIVRSCSDEM